MQQERMWMIVGSRGLYTGSWLTRIEAIEHHIRARQAVNFSTAVVRNRPLLTKHGRDAWACLRREGDRAVRVTVSWE